MASITVEAAACFGQPGGPQDRTQPAKLEIPFGHAFDRRGVSLCACIPRGPRSAIEEYAVLGVPGRVGRHEGALRDHSFSVASQGFEDAMRQPRSVPQAGQLLRHLRMEQDDPAVFDLVVRDCDRTVAKGHFKPAHGRIVPDVAFHLLSPSLSQPTKLGRTRLTWTAPTGCLHQWARVAHGRTRMTVFPARRSVELKVATASSRVETLPIFVRSRPSRTRWTISPSWARSDSTTKSIAKPSAGRASSGPTMDTSVPPARIRPADRFWMSPPMTSHTRPTPPTP